MGPTFVLVTCMIAGYTFALCPSYEFDLDGQRCCKKCPPGNGAKQPCTAENNTVCAPCVHRVTYSSHHSHDEVCKPCSKCEPGSHIKHPCNVTHDTQCECDPGFYYDVLGGICEICQSCQPGWGASKRCSHKQDTVCRKCPSGSYSNTYDLLGCRVCTVCKKNQIKLQECNPEQDTLCLDIPRPTHVTPIMVHINPANQEGEEEPARGADIIPLYCAIMGLVVAGLLVYVIIKHWRTNTQNKRACTKYAANGPLTGPLIENECQIQHQVPFGGSDSGVYLDHDGRTVTSAMKIRDLPPNKRKEVETRLQMKRGGRGDWERLARELGYNKSRIASFEVRGDQNHNVPARYLLLEWSKSENATVGVLVRALRNIGRHDVVKILTSPSNYLKSQAAEVV